MFLFKEKSKRRSNKNLSSFFSCYKTILAENEWNWQAVVVYFYITKKGFLFYQNEVNDSGVSLTSHTILIWKVYSHCVLTGNKTRTISCFHFLFIYHRFSVSLSFFSLSPHLYLSESVPQQLTLKTIIFFVIFYLGGLCASSPRLLVFNQHCFIFFMVLCSSVYHILIQVK